MLWVISVIAEQEMVHALAGVVLLTSIPLALRFPTIACTLFTVCFAALVMSGRSPGLLFFVVFLLVFVVAAQGRLVLAVLTFSFVGLLGFYSSELGTFTFEVVSGLLFALFGAIALSAGYWYFRHDELSKAREAFVRQRNEQVQQLLHDSVAADLTAMVVRLEGMAIRKPELSTELGECAHLARRSIKQTRALIDRYEEFTNAETKSSPHQLLKSLRAFESRLSGNGFTVNIVKRIDCLPEQAASNDALHQCLGEIATNIIKYGDPRTEVKLECSSTSDELNLRIENGISNAERSSNSSMFGLKSVFSAMDAVSGKASFRAEGDVWISQLTLKP